MIYIQSLEEIMNLFTALQEVLQLIQKMKFKMVRDLFYHIDGYKEACTNSILQFEGRFQPQLTSQYQVPSFPLKKSKPSGIINLKAQEQQLMRYLKTNQSYKIISLCSQVINFFNQMLLII